MIEDEGYPDTLTINLGDDLRAALDGFCPPIRTNPAERTKAQVERWKLKALLLSDVTPFHPPFHVTASDRPDFILQDGGRQVGLEVTMLAHPTTKKARQVAYGLGLDVWYPPCPKLDQKTPSAKSLGRPIQTGLSEGYGSDEPERLFCALLANLLAAKVRSASGYQACDAHMLLIYFDMDVLLSPKVLRDMPAWCEILATIAAPSFPFSSVFVIQSSDHVTHIRDFCHALYRAEREQQDCVVYN